MWEAGCDSIAEQRQALSQLDGARQPRRSLKEQYHTFWMEVFQDPMLLAPAGAAAPSSSAAAAISSTAVAVVCAMAHLQHDKVGAWVQCSAVRGMWLAQCTWVPRHNLT